MGGWAWYVDDSTRDAGSVIGTTNNVMELTAIKNGIAHFDASTPLHIITDSRYAIGCLTEWHRKWRHNGWKTRDYKTREMKPVKNALLIRLILASIEGCDITWEHTRGHVGHPLNEKADALATEQVQKRRARGRPT